MYTDGIIFDMDGTIWDTCQAVADTWQRAANENNVEVHFTAELMASCMGLLMEAFGAKVMPEIESSLRMKILKEGMDYENEYLAQNGGYLYPGFIDMVEELSKTIPLFIVSNCQAGYIEAFFEAHHTEKYFKDYENPGRTGLDKAGNIRLICERNGLKAPIYVGDTQGDADACKAANVPFVFAAYGFGSVDSKDYIAKIEKCMDLCRLVKSNIE